MTAPTFDFAAWQAMFPQFAAMPEAVAQGYFDVAFEMFGSTPCAQCFAQPSDGSQSTPLSYLTAHIATLMGTNAAGQPNTPLVGRVNTATQGSVSVGAEMPNQPHGAAWYQQTQAGAMFWVLTAKCRQAQYAPARSRNLDPFNPFGRC